MSVIGWQRIVIYFVVLFCIYTSGNCRHHRNAERPLSVFTSYHKFTPYVYQESLERSKREVPINSVDTHIKELIISVNLFGVGYIVDLIRNQDLLPRHHFERHHSDGKYTIRRPFANETLSHCYYKGKLRDVTESWVALSTCNGLSGVIFDGNELHYVEPSGVKDIHYAYRHSDHNQHNLTCGYQGNNAKFANYDSVVPKRFRRDASFYAKNTIDSKSRYVELVLVNDNKLFRELGDLEAVYSRNKAIANIINALYTPLNISIALVGVVVWSEFDEITLSPNGDTTLTNFLYYRKQRLVQLHPNDNAQLLTAKTFDGGVVSKALKGPICTYEFSGGVNMNHSPLVGLVATTVAHSLGHNFGMEHDYDDCDCPDERCIMAPTVSQTSPTHWSNCSLEYLKIAYDHGMDYCLLNKPEDIVGPVCGNGFVENGEDCDCGLKEFCNNPCCNASSCSRFLNATCATGDCCDLKTCNLKPRATLCRAAEDECDLPEFCKGESEFCPANVYTQNGIPCKGAEAYCFHGHCRTHTDQCKRLWGPTGQMSNRLCFEINRKGNSRGNCGYFKMNQTYKACSVDNILCGMLQCTHLNDRLQFGFESTAILARSFITENGKLLACHSAILDFGLNSADPGLTPDGARCGDEKICVSQKCLPVSSLKVATCSHNCSGNGVFNSNCHCHCKNGYAPPFCDSPGAGGSEDSGPATHTIGFYKLVTFFWIYVFRF